MHAFIPVLCALLPIARGEFESWDMHGASSLPPRHYLDAFSRPHVLRRVCLRRGGCAGGVALSDAEVAGLPLEDVVFGDGHAAKQRPSLLSPRNRRLARGERRKKLAEKTTTGAAVLLEDTQPCYVSAASNWTTTKYLGETLDLALLGERPNAWVGRASSTAAAHYDAAVNSFAVVRGSKRFLVAPPGTVEDERSYLHPHFRRSRSLAAADDQEVVAAGFEAVDLDAGDVLVLPAYWWHQVSTVDGFSISVNAWRGRRRSKKRWRSRSGPTTCSPSARTGPGATRSPCWSGCWRRSSPAC
ncbi:tRNA-Phe hydroxylase [Aureococcus anophagefferens]|nr:tRNA-Phe hydroxylase [Aureococcus anophagefferens]